jgi:HD superfamily phosphohydrolase
MARTVPVIQPPLPASVSSSARFLSGKQFNCGVHGMIRFDDLCIKIIDSPSFQRLHGLKQLGTCDFVFRNATHTRFEHSIGVAYLAEKMVKVLRDNQPDLHITNEDVRCVQIAGLCHDLGKCLV